MAGRTTIAEAAATSGAPSRSAWRRLLRSPTGLLGLVIVLTLVLTALLADLIAPYSPLQMAAG
ncbi:MAG: ABC transporter permease, partial [Pseudomonadota bacterium]